MDTTRRTSTRPLRDATNTEDLSRRLIAAAAAYKMLGDVVRERRDVRVPAKVAVTLTWEHGIALVEVADPDTASAVADILGLTRGPGPLGELINRSTGQHTYGWRGAVCDVPVVLVGRGRLADDITDQMAARILNDIAAVTATATRLDVTA